MAIDLALTVVLAPVLAFVYVKAGWNRNVIQDEAKRALPLGFAIELATIHRTLLRLLATALLLAGCLFAINAVFDFAFGEDDLAPVVLCMWVDVARPALYRQPSGLP